MHELLDDDGDGAGDDDPGTRWILFNVINSFALIIECFNIFTGVLW